MEERCRSPLEVHFAGLTLASPCIVASSVLTGDMIRIGKAAAAGAGGVSTKMAMVGESRQSHPDVIVRPGTGGIVSAGDRRLSLDEARALVRRARRETDLTIIANLLAPAADEMAWQRGAVGLQEAGAQAVELDLSCPNLPGRSSARSVAQSPVDSGRVTRAVKSAVNVPVLCKLTAQVADIAEVARVCELSGADAVVVINGFPAAPEIDIRKGGRPTYLTSSGHSFGTLTGSPLFPIACRAVADVSRAVSIPVLGCGGISSWEEAVQMMMWGASAVQICSSILVRGFSVLDKINEGISAFMNEAGYGSPADFVGAALQYVVPAESIVRRRVELSVIDEKCTRCGLCLMPGICLALSESPEGISIDTKRCLNCGVCIRLCPNRAITPSDAVEASIQPHRT
ncbi:MAG: 4Fe-4S binding protein [Deferrisomatales bacterium]